MPKMTRKCFDKVGYNKFLCWFIFNLSLNLTDTMEGYCNSLGLEKQWQLTEDELILDELI